ncbi:MAG: hypothetical protein OHK0024_24420 [Thalassobaculales bacterium]
MFTVRPEITYERRVDVEIPSTKRPGHFDTESFYATFRTLPVDRAQEIAAAYSAAPGAGSTDYVNDLMHEVVVDWREVQDEQGGRLPFSTEALDQLLQVPFARAALMQAYIDSLSGRAVKARATGN